MVLKIWSLGYICLSLTFSCWPFCMNALVMYRSYCHQIHSQNTPFPWILWYNPENAIQTLSLNKQPDTFVRIQPTGWDWLWHNHGKGKTCCLFPQATCNGPEGTTQSFTGATLSGLDWGWTTPEIGLSSSPNAGSYLHPVPDWPEQWPAQSVPGRGRVTSLHPLVPPLCPITPCSVWNCSI